MSVWPTSFLHSDLCWNVICQRELPSPFNIKYYPFPLVTHFLPWFIFLYGTYCIWYSKKKIHIHYFWSLPPLEYKFCKSRVYRLRMSETEKKKKGRKKRYRLWTFEVQHLTKMNSKRKEETKWRRNFQRQYGNLLI